MSVKATKWAWESELPSGLKLVLLALADCHNSRSGQCNPRIDTIAEKTNRSVRSVQYAMKDLGSMGYIRPIRRRKGARQAANQYELALDGVVFSGCRKQQSERPP